VDEAVRCQNVGTTLMLSAMMKAAKSGTAAFTLYYESNIESSRRFYEEKIPRITQIHPSGRMFGHYANGNPRKCLQYNLVS
jgi:hypothetical protein